MPKATATKKDLYLGKSLADLHTLSDVTRIDSSSDVIVRSMKKIFDEAEKLDGQGDEERAYVMYMRYFNTLTKVKNKADYKSKKDYFDKLIGVVNQRAAIERAEQLSESLKERYDFKQAEVVAKKFSSLDSPGKSDDKSPVIAKPAVNVKKDINAGWNPKTVIAGVTCPDLNTRLSGAGTNMVILDIRPRSDFAKSHIPFSHCINVPEDILLPGSSVSDIQSGLPKESQDLCLKLQRADQIVLMDWRSRAGQAVDKIPLQVLVTALSKPDSGIKTQPVLLDGGFEQWLLFQASATTGQIRTENLCDLLRDNSKSVLLMDVRPRADYLQSHISHTHCISVPEDILTPGSTVTHIQSKLPEESREFWMKRKEFSFIILLDWSSTLDIVAVRSPLRTLKDALFKFDPSPPIKSEPQVLQGGYAQWLLLYPALTTNPHVAKPGDKNHQRQASPTMLLEFDYPDFDEKPDSNPLAELNQPYDVTPEESSSSDSSFYSAIFDKVPLPQVNRSLKPSRPITGSPASTVSTDIKTALNQEVLASSVFGITDKKHDPLLSGISATNKVTPNGPVTPGIMTSQTNNKSFKQKLVIDSVKPPTPGDNQEPNLQQTNGGSPGVSVEKRTQEVEKSLRDLEQMRRKEQKDVADLMRLKRKLEMELASLRQEGQSQQLAAEQAQRVLAAEHALREEEEKKNRLEAEDRARRLEEVERLRLERKKEEQLKELQFEEEKKKENENKTIQKNAEEKLIESMRAIKKEEERFKIEEEIKKQEESDRALKQQLLEQQKREAEEAQIRQKEQEALMIQLAEERRIQEERHRQKLLMEKEQERQKQEAEERLKIEALAREQAQKDKEAAEKIHQLKISGQEASKLVPSNQLPTGWEKRLDRATNRYFYIDHNRGTTQWTSPAESLTSTIHSDIYKTQLKSEPTVSSSRGLSRSHSSPNIKKLFEEGGEEEPSMPSVDRSKKPVISSVLPLPRQTAHVIKKRDLNPVFGNVAEGLTGLKNLGNTCYMNSTIQCLNNTAQLASYFVNDNYLNDINRESAQGMHGEVVEDFAIVVKALWSQQYRSIMPRDLKNTVGKYNPMFAGYQQQDSQEFLTFLLDGLHEGLNEVRKAPDIPEQNNENLADEVAANQAWQYHIMLHKSIIVHLFQGQLKSTLTCKTCGKTSVTFQAFMFLSLPIKDNSRCSLQDCIQEFLKPELMTGSSRWKCPRCKVERDTLKKIDIFKLPPILLIGLNRFYSEGMWTQKKSNYVDFPADDLDMSPFIIGPKNRNKYSLYGVSNHYGTMEGGHYTAVCRNPSTKKWYLFDDQDVSEIAQSQVKTSAAYVLYYTSMNVYKPAFKPQL